jgi:hypothetical protein
LWSPNRVVLFGWIEIDDVAVSFGAGHMVQLPANVSLRPSGIDV